MKTKKKKQKAEAGRKVAANKSSRGVLKPRSRKNGNHLEATEMDIAIQTQHKSSSGAARPAINMTKKLPETTLKAREGAATSKGKYFFRELEIFIEPKQYAKRENLPFVKSVKGLIQSAWSVKPYNQNHYGNDYHCNNRLGFFYAFLFLAHNQYADQNPGVERLSLSRVLRDMPKIPAPGMKDDSYDYGIEVGFLEIIEKHLYLQPYGIPEDGVSMTIKLLCNTGDKFLELRSPFYALEECAAKRKAKAERESQELAKPANLRKLSERIQKMRTIKQALAVSDTIKNLPESHREKFNDEWHDKAASISHALFFPTLIDDSKKSKSKKGGRNNG